MPILENFLMPSSRRSIGVDNHLNHAASRRLGKIPFNLPELLGWKIPLQRLVSWQREEQTFQVDELSALVGAEQNRWLEFNARLDEIERGLASR
jgi:hypothetical protein